VRGRAGRAWGQLAEAADVVGSVAGWAESADATGAAFVVLAGALALGAFVAISPTALATAVAVAVAVATAV
jgi:hypothetical protein